MKMDGTESVTETQNHPERGDVVGRRMEWTEAGWRQPVDRFVVTILA